jgi:hypothetical protein
VVQVPAIAAENRHPAILALAAARGLRLLGRVAVSAIKGRSLESLEIMLAANPKNVPPSALVIAAAHGYLDGVRLLHKFGFYLWNAPIDAEGLFALRMLMEGNLTAPHATPWGFAGAYGTVSGPALLCPTQCTWDMVAGLAQAAAVQPYIRAFGPRPNMDVGHV